MAEFSEVMKRNRSLEGSMHKTLLVLAITLTAMIALAPLASAAGMLDVKLVSISSPVAPGKSATLIVQTTPRPGAQLK